MYIFSRTRQVRPEKMIDAIAPAVEIAEKVTQITGVPIHVWTSRFGAPLGTMMWSCRMDSQSELHEATEKLAVDATYLEMAMAMTEHYQGPAQDALVRVVSGRPSPEPSKFTVLTRATMANGHFAEAVAWGVGMQEFVCDALDAPGAFVTSAYDGFSDVGWILGLDSMADLDAAADWEATDADYQERVAGAGDLFIAGSGHRSLIEKLN